MSRLSFDMICAMLAARRCYEGGVPVAVIAKQAGKSKSTIYRWLAIAQTPMKK